MTESQLFNWNTHIAPSLMSYDNNSSYANYDNNESLNVNDADSVCSQGSGTNDTKSANILPVNNKYSDFANANQEVDIITRKQDDIKYLDNSGYDMSKKEKHKPVFKPVEKENKYKWLDASIKLALAAIVLIILHVSMPELFGKIKNIFVNVFDKYSNNNVTLDSISLNTSSNSTKIDLDDLNLPDELPNTSLSSET